MQTSRQLKLQPKMIPFKDIEIAEAYFTRDDVAFTWICTKCSKRVRQTGIGHKTLIAHVKFIHTNFDAEMRAAFALSGNTSYKVCKDLFVTEAALINIHSHTITAAAINAELDERPDRVDELKSLDGIDDWTPIAFACHNWNWDVALALAARGADVNIANSRGMTPLMCAANGGSLKVVSKLVGAIIEARDWKGRTALMRACKNNHIQVAEHLVLGGASVESVDEEGRDSMSYLSFQEDRTRLTAAMERSSRRFKLQ